MRIRPTRTVETAEECPDCGETIRHREVGFAVADTDTLQWLVASRFCSTGCIRDEHRPDQDT